MEKLKKNIKELSTTEIVKALKSINIFEEEEYTFKLVEDFLSNNSIIISLLAFELANRTKTLENKHYMDFYLN